MRSLLIHPPTNFLEQCYGVKQKVRFGHAPPLNLGYIAAYLEKDGHKVAILDASAMELGMDETLERIESFYTDLVGLTVLTNLCEIRPAELIP